jgi:RNA polymerase sigma-70 factor, ECF subfamily
MAALTNSFTESAPLLQHAATGEHAEFTSLVERNADFAFRVAKGVLRRREDAEEAVQETFFKLYRTGAWKRMEDEKAFLARAVWREALDLLPKRTDENITEEHQQIPTSAVSPESNALESSARIFLRSLIDTLHEDLRQPLVLSALQELNSHQIGLVMGIPEGTVRTRLQRARAELKREFESRKRISNER